MDPIFTALSAHPVLAPELASALVERGFIVLPGPIASNAIGQLQAAYDAAMGNAVPADIHHGQTSTRVNDFVNRGAEFDPLYTFPPALDAACQVIGGPFRLSVMHARTLHAGSPAQGLHVDIPRTSDAWPMIGVIIMVDAFTPENGATRFIPGSHRDSSTPDESIGDPLAPFPGEVLALGPAGSVIIFNASTWHGWTANTSGVPRRSIQFTFIPRSGRPATNFPARLTPATLPRLGPLARYLIGMETDDTAD